MTMRFGHLIFDLDGTLVDTTPALTCGLNETLATLGRRNVSAETVVRITGHGLRALLRSAILLTGTPITDLALHDAVHQFRAAYERELLARALPAPGALEACTALHTRGLRLAVLTNKPLQSSVHLLAHLGYADLIEYVVGGDMDLPRKPDAGGLLTILAQWGASREDALLVGSSLVDLQTGRNGDVHVALISPFGGRQRTFGLGADFVLDAFDQLEPLLCSDATTQPSTGT